MHGFRRWNGRCDMEILTVLKANIRRKKGSFIGIIVLMLIISMALTAFLSIKQNCTESIKNALEYAGAPDITVYISGNNRSDELIEALETHEFVDRVVQVEVSANYLAFDGEKDGNKFFLQSYDSTKLKRLKDDLSGYSDVTDNPQKGEIYVTQGTLTRNHAKLGDVVEVYSDYSSNESVKMKITGIIVEPVNGASVMGWKQAFVSEEDYEMLLGRSERSMYMLKIYKRSGCGLSDRSFRRQLNRDTSVIDKAIGSLTKSESLHYTSLFTEITISILLVFLVFLMVIVLIVMRHSISTSIETDYVNLGVLKAMGFSKHKIRSIFILQYIIAQLIGAVIGFILAIPIVSVFGNIFQPITSIPNENIIAAVPCLLILLGILAVSMVFVLFSTRRINAISPVRAISGGRNEIYFDSRIKAPVGKKLLVTGIAFRQITSAKRRYAGTMFIATMLVFFMLTVTALSDSISSKSALESMGEIYTEVELALTAPDEFELKTEEIEDIIEKYAKIEKRYQLECEYISINGENIMCAIYKNPEAMNVYKGRKALYDNEIMITEFIAEELDIGIGDRVTVSKGDKKADFLITGFFQWTNDVGRCFCMNLDGVKRMGFEEATIDWAGYSISDTSHLEDIKAEINEKYGDILECTVSDGTEEMSVYQTATDLVKVVIDIFSVVFALVVTIMVCKKCFLQEKTDIGIYKAVGFKISSLRLQFAIRFLIIAAVSSVIGLGLSILLSEKMVTMLLRNMGISAFALEFHAGTFLIPIVMICFCFFAFSYIVSRKIKEVDIKVLITE